MGSQAIPDAKRGQYFMIEPEALVIIGLAGVKGAEGIGPLDTKDGKEHEYWDERIHLPVPPEKVANVARHGVRLPAEVVKDGERLIVTDGRQRTRWARVANKERKKKGLPPLLVKVLVVKGTSEEVNAVSNALNACRLDDSELVKGRKCLRQHTLYGTSYEEMAVDMGVGVGTVRRWVALTGTSDAVQEALETGEVTATQASAVAKLPHAEQKAGVAAVKKANEERKARPKAPKGSNNGNGSHRTKAPPRLKLMALAESVASKEVRAALLYAVGSMPEAEARLSFRGWPEA